jgi:hypothetical protein
MSFFNSSAPLGGILDQAWVEYDFQGQAAFLSASVPGTQLDPSNCNPLQVGPNVKVLTPAIPGTTVSASPPAAHTIGAVGTGFGP